MDSDQRASSKVFRIFHHLYSKVETLEHFVESIVPADQLSWRTNDSVSYKKLINTTLVCHPHGARAMPKTFCLEHQSQQIDVIIRAVERIIRREVRSSNLLAFGYRPMSENPYAQVAATSWYIESVMPNPNISRLLYTPWKTLLTYIGDDAMEYLLENLAVFQYASSSCYIQLTGIPLFELWPFKNSSAKSFRSKVVMRSCNSLLSNSWYRRDNSRKPKARAHQIDKCTSTSTAEVGVSVGQKRKLENMVTSQASTTCVEIDGNGNEKKESNGEGDCCDEPAGKRHCVETAVLSTEHLSTAGDFYSSVDEIRLILDGLVEAVLDATASSSKSDHGVASPSMSAHCSKATERLDSIWNRTLMSEQGVCCDDHLPLTSESSYYSCQSTKDVSLLQTNLLGADSGSVDCPLTGLVSSKMKKKKKRKRKGKCSVNSGGKDGIKCQPFNSRLTLRYSSCFYSQDFTEDFPPSRLLSGFTAADAPKIVQQILETDVFNNPNFTAAEVAETRSLPERYVDVKSQLVEIIHMFFRNHQSCRYKYLLDFHCTAAVCKPVETCSQRKKAGQLDFSAVPVFTRKTESLNSAQQPTDTSAEQLPTPSAASAAGQSAMQSSSKLSSKSTTARSDTAVSNSRKSSNIGLLLERFVSHRQVYLFVRSCCLRVIPTALFGCVENRNVFFRNVSRLIDSRRFELLSLGSLMSGMKVCRCRWMAKIHSNTDKLRLFAKLVYWLMNSYVGILIRSYFYITDSTNYRNHMFYYRKSVWKVIHSKVCYSNG